MSNVRIMNKPYHIVAYDNDNKEIWKAKVQPPQLPGPNKDGKSVKDKNGQWVRNFTVIDPMTSSLSVDDSVIMSNETGKLSVCSMGDLVVKLEVIDGVKAPKPRKPKNATQNNTGTNGVLVVGSTTDDAAETTTDALVVDSEVEQTV